MTDAELRPKQANRTLFEIWEETIPVLRGANPWKCQLVNYVGSFPTKAAAEKYVAAVIKEREKHTH
jgi:hypothetical protein